MTRDKTYGIDIPGVNDGETLRPGIDRIEEDIKRNEGPWLLQFYVFQKSTQFDILIDPQQMRNGLRNTTYDGVGVRNKPRKLLVSGVGHGCVCMTGVFESGRKGARTCVNEEKLRQCLSELFERLDDC